MMRNKLLLTLFACFCLIRPTAAQQPIDYVDPMIGTTNFSVCNPGAVLPHGLMSVVPFNVMGSDLNEFDKDARWWSAPYEKNNKFFTGFAHVTLSGVGCPEMGTLLTMPTNKLDVDYHNYGTTYSNEKSTPGYYSVNLDNGIKAEATATLRTSIERFTFATGGEKHLLRHATARHFLLQLASRIPHLLRNESFKATKAIGVLEKAATNEGSRGAMG